MSIVARVVARTQKTAESDAVYKAAAEAFRSLVPDLQHQVTGFLGGVFSGRAQPLEGHASELYQAYEGVRQVVKSVYGGSVTLYRGEPKNKPSISRGFLSWTPSRRLAASFADKKGFEIVEADVRVSDIVAVLISPHNATYVEYLVKQRPEYHTKGITLHNIGFVDIDSATLWDAHFAFNPERAKVLGLKAQKAIEGGGGEVLRVRVDEENEGVTLTVVLPAEMEPDARGLFTLAGYKVESLKPYAGK